MIVNQYMNNGPGNSGTSVSDVDRGVEKVFTEEAEMELRRINKVFPPGRRKGLKTFLVRGWSPRSKDTRKQRGIRQRRRQARPLLWGMCLLLEGL